MCLRLFPFLAAGALAHSLLAVDNTLASAGASADADTDEETRAVLGRQWDDVERDLERFRDVAARVCSLSPVKLAPNAFGAASVLEIGSAPAAASNRSKHENGPASHEIAQPGNKPQQFLAAPLVSGKELKDAAQQAMLAPMLVMLKDLYKQGREKIVELNKEDKKSKEKFEAQEKRHKDKLAHLQSEAKKFKWSAGFLSNQTKGEDKMFGHKRVKRELQHRQYHTMLKIKHLQMAKEKKMIQMYEGTIAGTANPEEVEKTLNGGGRLGEVVFFQMAESAREFCATAMATARAQRREVEGGP